MKKIEITVSEIGGLDINPEGFVDSLEILSVLQIAASYLQQEMVKKSNLIHRGH